MKLKIHQLPPQHVHMLVQGSISATAFAGLFTHVVAPEIDILMATVAAITGYWAVDIENWVKHDPKIVVIPRKKGYRGSRRRALAIARAAADLEPLPVWQEAVAVPDNPVINPAVVMNRKKEKVLCP